MLGRIIRIKNEYDELAKYMVYDNETINHSELHECYKCVLIEPHRSKYPNYLPIYILVNIDKKSKFEKKTYYTEWIVDDFDY